MSEVGIKIQGNPAIDPGFAEEVAQKTGTNPGLCLSCLCCSGGCPFYGAMDIGPHGVMRRIQFGLYDEALRSTTIWLCVGCQTCSSACPAAIDIVGVMDLLRRTALENGIAPSDPVILEFHREVLGSIERYGRTHKLEIMLRWKARQGGWFQDMDVGLKMLAKRKLDLRPSRIRDPGELKKIFDRTWRR